MTIYDIKSIYDFIEPLVLQVFLGFSCNDYIV